MSSARLAQLASCIAQHAPQPVAEVSVLVDTLVASFGSNLRAVLLYGSCLHNGNLNGLFDLYMLVDDYRATHRHRLAAIMNALLPPNVYYLEAELDTGQRVRAKYALLSLADFQRGVSRRWFHSYLWARFCQPTALVWVRDRTTADEIYLGFAEAVCTFIGRTLPLLQSGWSLQELWLKGLGLTYRAEFRPEQPNRQLQLFTASTAFFTAITPLALTMLDNTAVAGGDAEPACDLCCDRQGKTRSAWFTYCSARLAWRVRIAQGKVLSMLRLMKAAFTFKGGVDYIVWKIERHSGVRLEVTPFLRRHPFLALCCLSFRLYRKGGVR
ncbi:MAG: hypothetical protein GX087_00260 [Desulfobulbaceae bacterium]|nr:hypothetical protein [Desulfobulbaceae bacterium]